VLKVVQAAGYADYQYQDTTGAYQTIRVNYTSMPVKTAFGCAGIVEATMTSLPFPTSVVLPNGQQYTFTYEMTPGAFGYTTGQLLRVTLPTGGYYDYARTGPNDGVYCADGSATGVIRIINDGETSAGWVFTRQALSGGSWQTTVSAPQLPYDPAHNVSLYEFDSTGRETRQRLYQGADVLFDTPMVEIITTYPSTQRMWLTRTTTVNRIDGGSSGSKTSHVEYDYDSYGLPTETREYDWDWSGQIPVDLGIRKTEFSYVRSTPYTTRQITDRVASIVVSDCQVWNVCTPVYKAAIAYDASALTCVVGAMSHDDTNYPCTFLTRGNPTSTTEYANPGGSTGAVTRSIAYDSLGNPRSADMACCRQKAWSYSAADQYTYPNSETTGTPGGPQLTEATTYNFPTGLLATFTDPNSKVTSYAFDSMKRLTTVTRPDGTQPSVSYVDSGTDAPSVTLSVPIVSGSARRTSIRFDGLGRPKRQALSNADGTTTYSVVDQQYDALGNRYRTSNPYVGSPDYWTEIRYDALYRPVLIIPPDGTASTNNIGILYRTDTAIQTDQSGAQREFTYDGHGRVIKVREPNPTTGAPGLATTYEYNALNLVRTITTGPQIRSFVYDGLGRLVSRSSPESGTESFQYGSFGELTQSTDSRGVVTTYQYDTLNRLTQRSYAVGGTGASATPTVTLVYGTNPAANTNGRLVSVTDGSGQRSIAYDVMGRVTQVTQTILGAAYSVGYAYNLAGDLTSIQYPSGRIALSTFDAVGRPSSVTFGGASYMSGATYNASEHHTGYTLGTDIQAMTQFNSDSILPASLTYTKQGQMLFGLTYGYSLPNGGTNGSITSIADSVQPGRSVNYTYDYLRRLTSAETAGSAEYAKWKLAWAYDAYGNRLSQTVQSGTGPSNILSVDATTNRISSQGYGYDAAGNLTSFPGSTLAFDGQKRATAYSGTASINYTYDSHDLRAIKSEAAGATVYIYSGSRLSNGPSVNSREDQRSSPIAR
jgi:YD repeat-containing protein